MRKLILKIYAAFLSPDGKVKYIIIYHIKLHTQKIAIAHEFITFPTESVICCIFKFMKLLHSTRMKINLFQKVDYAGIAKSSEFEQYKKLARELTRVQIADASREEKLAFFINTYNALVIHGNIAWGGGPSGLWQRYKVTA